MSDVIDKAMQLLEADQYSECFQVMAAEIERLRAVLRQIAELDGYINPGVQIAREALAQTNVCSEMSNACEQDEGA